MLLQSHRLLFSQVIILICFPFFVQSQQLDQFSSLKPFNIRGNFSTNLIGYGANGIDNRLSPFAFMVSANATASFYGISMPFSVRYSNQRLDYTQPFNQFGLSPSYKWAKAHVGYRSVNFSNFTMAGHNFLGGGVELNPGKFRFGFVYGRFKKSAVAFEQALDTTQTLTRKGYGAKIGVGSDKTFIDLVFLRIRDDSTAVQQNLNSSYKPAEENTVTGINSRVALSRTLSFESELAASIYTTDMSAPEIEIDDDSPGLQRAAGLMHVNLSSELLTAVRASLNYRTQLFSTRLEYRRIDPGYRSMGAYFINNDIENLTIAPTLSLFNRKLNLRGSVGVQRDNLRNAKRATSLRTISSAQVSYNPAPVFGIDFSYSNYSSNQRAGRVPLIDSLKLFQANSNFTIAPRFLFAGTRYNHMLVAVMSRMELFDRNTLTKLYTENQATLFTVNYSLNILEHKATLMAGYNYNKLESFAGIQSAGGLTFGAQKVFLDGKFNAGLNNSIIRMNYQQGPGWTTNISLNTGYQVTRKHALRFNLYYIRSAFPEGMPSTDFNEIKGDMSYVYTF
jgi:hypothetical protein